MAQTLNLSRTIPNQIQIQIPHRTHRLLSSQSHLLSLTHNNHRRSHFNGRINCFFSNNRKKEEQVKKALENALGGKNEQFEKRNTEVKKKKEGGGGNKAGGGGGWFGGGGGRFSWFSDDHFWEETQQTSLTILAILGIFLLFAKGDAIFAAVVNPLLFALRRIRESFRYVAFRIDRMVNGENAVRVDVSPVTVSKPSSAKERVLKKWGSD